MIFTLPLQITPSVVETDYFSATFRRIACLIEIMFRDLRLSNSLCLPSQTSFNPFSSHVHIANEDSTAYGKRRGGLSSSMKI